MGKPSFSRGTRRRESNRDMVHIERNDMLQTFFVYYRGVKIDQDDDIKELRKRYPNASGYKA